MLAARVLFGSLFVTAPAPCRCSRITVPMASSSSSSTFWSCSRCTFLNPQSQKLSCEMCFSPSVDAAGGDGNTSSVTVADSPGRWPCSSCTYLNHRGSAVCHVCGTRPASFSRFLSNELDPDELAATGSVFLPLQRCGSKRPAPMEASPSAGALGKFSRDEEEEHLDLSDVSDRSSDRQVIKILSYNVWFREDLEVHRRMEAIGNHIQKHRPDFLCFQEVTPNIYRIFQSSEWWKAYRCSVPQDLAAERPYFCMQMSKLPEEAFKSIPFANSIMGRELCLASIKLSSGKGLVIATSHLESPCPAPPKWDQMYSAERVSQAKECVARLKNSTNAIFAGDMNWDDKLDGAFPLPDEGWVDAWAAKRTGEDGWTYDTKSNNMLSGNRNLQKRLDRFVCKLKDFRIDSIEMVGNEAIPGLFYHKEKKARNKAVRMELPVFPSDHYGLLLTISSL